MKKTAVLFLAAIAVLTFLSRALDKMCIRDRQKAIFDSTEIYKLLTQLGADPVSYTHLDVYKRQVL